MAKSSPRWLDIVRHRVGRVRTPFLLIVQHHDLPGNTLLVAPINRRRPGEPTALAPIATLDGLDYSVRLLEIAASPRSLLLDTVGSAEHDAGTILDALDIILHGYPIGRPR